MEVTVALLPNDRQDVTVMGVNLCGVDLAASAYKASIAKRRERLVVPADPVVVNWSGEHYSSKLLGV
jgi:hypothetical protein